MSRQAEAERERRARIISADGEYQASKRLAAAANVMARDPAALQLRLLQTVVEVAGEKNSTLVMPVPVELLRFFDRVAPAVLARGRAAAAADPGSLMADVGRGSRGRRPKVEAEKKRAGRRPRPGDRQCAIPAIPEAARADGGGPPARSPSRQHRSHQGEAAAGAATITARPPRRGARSGAWPRPGAPTGDGRKPRTAGGHCRTGELPAARRRLRRPSRTGVLTPVRASARVDAHAEVGVRDRAVARARDQADPRQLGDDGWELVALVPGPNSEQLVAYMKRPKE